MRLKRSSGLATLLFLSILIPIFAQDNGRRPLKPDIQPPDVFLKLSILDKELELLLEQSGYSAPPRLGIIAKDARPREVYSQALSLHRKADQWAFETLSDRRDSPRLNSKVPQPKDVFLVVVASLERIRSVKAAKAITQQVVSPELERHRTPTDVYNKMMSVNRKMNVLLERASKPRDAFSEVTHCMGYTARLLSKFRGANRIPPAPTLNSSADLSDSYKTLLQCLTMLQSIAEQSNDHVLTIDSSQLNRRVLTAADLYDLASLIVSELKHLHQKAANLRPPIRRFDPGPKTIAEVAQRAAHLKRQLETLQETVKNRKDWLGS